MRKATILLAALACSACAATPPPVNSLPAATVTASAETEPVGTAAADAADDPAIWRNPADPAASLIVATDKKAGLYVYGLDGKRRDFDADGRLNNVDLVDVPGRGVIVAASDRNDPLHALLRLYRLDTAAARLVPLGTVGGGTGEGYGLCLWAQGADLHAYSVLKDGTIEEYLLLLDGAPQARHLRTRKLATQTEGCVVDPRDGTLYVGEEDVGIWRFGASETQGTLVAPADGKQLVADTEGLAILPQGDQGGLLVASSQGDNAYALYRLPGMAPAGRFRIGAGAYGATSETDGIALVGGSFGAAYPQGLFVAQDGDNSPHAQNFKLVSWQAVMAAVQPAP
ncbi:phytase [Novosphingobium album (ex Liu et al. 2023)]|uniref:Phytase n=1 Tax=Novosphingobium album (ex Liu et al. 2023) TaxID=3031130 RepID=A0ABT5WTL8_9SPHN|nr:phytase [Novosphingobium album (ex Liu et al. 2023)]MDE8653229.1 phytase [Novosphingobium album (ex Liu et al. 2023)]